MVELLKVLLSLSFSGTLLFLLILFLKRFYQSRFSRRWQYYIWLVVVLRFLVPFGPDNTVMDNLFRWFDSSFDREIVEESGGEKTESSDSGQEGIQAAGKEEGAQLELGIKTDSEVDGNITFHMQVRLSGYLFLVWMMIALLLFVRKVTAYQEFVRSIRAGSKTVSDVRILNLLSECEEKLNIKKQVELSCSEFISSPVMTGFFRPTVILPALELENRELSHIFTHELIHYKRRDLFYKWLVQITVCIHWFNPFVRLLSREVNKACELACDEGVLALAGEDAGREYGDVLLSFLRSEDRGGNSFATLTLTEGAEQLKERLGAIMDYRKRSGRTFAVSLLTAVFLMSAGIAIGAYAAPAAPREKEAVKIEVSGEEGNRVVLEENIFYIYCDGARESDKPIGVTSEGSVSFVLVRKDGYTATSGFTNLKTLVSDVARECDHMKEQGWMTQEERDLVIETAMTVTDIPGKSKETDAAASDYAVLTYRLAVENAPDVIQSWVQACDRFGENIFKTEYEGRYWIYTNAVGEGKDYRFEMTSMDTGSAAIEILPVDSQAGSGYALLSVPAGYLHLSAVCGDYVTAIDE